MVRWVGMYASVALWWEYDPRFRNQVRGVALGSWMTLGYWSLGSWLLAPEILNFEV